MNFLEKEAVKFKTASVIKDTLEYWSSLPRVHYNWRDVQAFFYLDTMNLDLVEKGDIKCVGFLKDSLPRAFILGPEAVKAASRYKLYTDREGNSFTRFCVRTEIMPNGLFYRTYYLNAGEGKDFIPLKQLYGYQ